MTKERLLRLEAMLREYSEWCEDRANGITPLIIDAVDILVADIAISVIEVIR